MKAFFYILLLVLVSSFIHDQEITGTWGGALEIQGASLRVVFHVKKKNDRYEATMDSPDQQVSGVAVTAIHINYPHVRFEVSSAGALFEGVISRQTLIGKWVQSGTALYLVLSKHDRSSNEEQDK